MTQRSARISADQTCLRIVDQADRLFYENGFESTSFADIADAVGVSRGNFYYHFKTKDDILAAVIARRLENTRAMLSDWGRDGSSPADRIRGFVSILITNRAKIIAFGCPVGTLSNELAKLDHRAHKDAAAIFTLFREWLADQFVALGHARQADDLALHLLMRSQGIAVLATAFRDESYVDREMASIAHWLGELTSPHSEEEPSCSSSL